jgi:hypothetical protein
MNSNPIKATLLPYSEVPHQTMLPLQNWLSGFEFFEFKSNPLMRVAVASNDKGAIISVCYIKIDDAFLITAMEINPKATIAEKKEASDGIDLLLEQQAQLAGVTMLFMVEGPRGNECKLVTNYTPRITSVANLQAPTQVAYEN